MDNRILQEKIERIVEDAVKQIQLREAVRNYIIEALNEEDSRRKENSQNAKRNYVNSLLSKTNKDFFGHAELSYKLWPNLDPDSARSKMSKCIRGERSFTDADIMKLYELLRKNK